MSSSALRLRAWVSVISRIISVMRSSIWSKDWPNRPTSSCPRMEERTCRSPCWTFSATLSNRTSGKVKARSANSSRPKKPTKEISWNQNTFWKMSLILDTADL
ncbi:hypothetical protein D3C76_1703050 [compost metagenome]